MAPPESFSRVPLRIDVVGKGSLKGEIIKHLAPSTAGALIHQGKISGRVTLEQHAVIVPTSIKVGPEKSRTQFSAGDIAFLPLNGELCIFLSGATTSRPMNIVGRVISAGDLLNKIARGDTIIFEVEGGSQPSSPVQ